jgi:hypothetical protein
MRSRTNAVLLAVTTCLAVHPLAAQVVRESDVSAVAGTLGGPERQSYDDFTFGSGGGEILFASLDAAIYQTQGASSHDDHEAAAMPGEEPGGCSSDLTYPVPSTGDDVPYLLDVSLRRVASPGPLAPAIAASKNKL